MRSPRSSEEEKQEPDTGYQRKALQEYHANSKESMATQI